MLQYNIEAAGSLYWHIWRIKFPSVYAFFILKDLGANWDFCPLFFALLGAIT